jgi:hypothetical protein
MTRVVLSALSLACLPFCVSAFDVPKPPSLPTGGGSVTTRQIDAFMENAASSDGLVRAASLQLFKAVASKKEIAKYEALVEAANKTQDPKEKKAKMEEADASVQASLQSTDWEKKNAEIVKQKNKEKNQAIANGLYNMALGALKDKDLVNTGTRLASGVPEPAAATRILLVKETVERLGSQANGLTKVVGSAKVLMTTVGLKELPTSSAEQAKYIKM